MNVEPLEVYAADTNYAVIKAPGRRFPGCVIQGDSLQILCGRALSIAKRVRDHGPQDDEFLRDLQDLVDSLAGRLLHYQRVLQAHEIELPYGRPITEADMVRLLPEDEDAQPGSKATS